MVFCKLTITLQFYPTRIAYLLNINAKPHLLHFNFVFSDSMAHVVGALSNDREVADFTPALGVYAVVPVRKALYVNFTGEFF